MIRDVDAHDAIIILEGEDPEQDRFQFDSEIPVTPRALARGDVRLVPPKPAFRAVRRGNPHGSGRRRQKHEASENDDAAHGSLLTHSYITSPRRRLHIVSAGLFTCESLIDSPSRES